MIIPKPYPSELIQRKSPIQFCFEQSCDDDIFTFKFPLNADKKTDEQIIRRLRGLAEMMERKVGKIQGN